MADNSKQSDESESHQFQLDDDEQKTEKSVTVSESSSKISDADSESGISLAEKRQKLSIPASRYNGFLFPAVPASPPKFVSIEQIMQAASGVSNMALAHEIAVNKDFKLDKIEPQDSIEKKVKEVVHKAFWDVFQQELNETPPNYSKALILLQEIKQGLMGIILPHTSIRQQIDEALDLDLIQQQIDNDALDFQYYTKFIISTMSRLCAPVRDEKIQELMTLTEVVPLYKGILETLDLMKLDMANFTIQQFRPHIEQHSIEYERKKFQEFLETLAGLTSPVDGLELTRKWLEKVYNKMVNLKDGENTSLSSEDIVIKAYIELLQWDDDEIFPETLLMDQTRFLAIRDQFIILVLAASILLVTYSVVGDAIQGITDFKKTLKDHVNVLLEGAPKCSSQLDLQSKLENIGLQVVKEVNDCLRKHGYVILTDVKTSALLSQIKDMASTSHSVRKLIAFRILEFFEQVLTLSKSVSVKIPPGLSAFQLELSDMAGQFSKLVTYNRAVFGDYYSQIISSIKTQK